MKRGYFWTYFKIIFIIAIIVAIIIGVVHFIKDEYDDELIETVKTDMLLIEAKTKVIGEKVKIKEKDASYVGKKITNQTEETELQELQDKGVIDLNTKENNYYILENEHLEELGLTTIGLKEGYYIVEYNSNEIIYSKGVEDRNGNILYKLSELSK